MRNVVLETEMSLRTKITNQKYIHILTKLNINIKTDKTTKAHNTITKNEIRKIALKM